MPEPEMWATIRRRFGWTIEFAAGEIGISVGHLEHFETGVRAPSDDVLESLAKTYGLHAGQTEARNWSKRTPPRFDAATQTLWIGWLAVDINGADNEAKLISIGSALRTMRSLAEGVPVNLRESEWDVFAPLFDLDDPKLVSLLISHFRLNLLEATTMVEHFNEVQAEG
jgi:transcriptional regulator with XRE-family HTH domain